MYSKIDARADIFINCARNPKSVQKVSVFEEYDAPEVRFELTFRRGSQISCEIDARANVFFDCARTPKSAQKACVFEDNDAPEVCFELNFRRGGDISCKLKTNLEGCLEVSC